MIFFDGVLAGGMLLGDTGEMRKLENMVLKSVLKSEAVSALK